MNISGQKSGNKKRISLFIFFSLLLVVLFLLDMFLGSVTIPFREIIAALFTGQAAKPEWEVIIFDFRLPKAITALMSGFALSVSGLQMQTIFRNPLAGPFVLGISSGATLGVALLVMGFAGVSAGSVFVSGNWAVAMSAWIGAGTVLVLIMLVSARVRDIMTILILGIMFGSATAAVVNILQYFSPASSLKAFVVWTMGSLSGVTHPQLQVMIPAVILGLFIAFFSVKNLNALLLGENYARSMGMNIKTTRFFVFLSTSLLAGTITAFCGPIGFIGIAVPHLVRIIFNTSNHQLLMPGSLILGGNALLISDIISQLPGSATTLPVNSITALLGIPVVIWIILRKRVTMFT